MNLRRIIISLGISLLLTVSFSTVLHARPFTPVGARGSGMGGAGVALIDSENAGQWNPANLGLSSAATEGDYATSLGLQAGGSLQTTRNFQRETQDLVDFADQFSISEIQGDTFSNTDRLGDYFRMFKELGDANRKGQGILGSLTGGINFRHTNWSMSVNNYTDFAVYTSFQLDQVITVALARSGVDSGTFRQVVSGDSGDYSLGGVSTNPTGDFEDASNTVENIIDKELEKQGKTLEDFGFQSGVTTKEVADAIADRVQQDAEDITASEFEQGARIVLPGIIQSVGGSGGNFAGGQASDPTVEAKFDTQNQELVFEGAVINEVAFHYAKPTPIATIMSSPLYVGGTVKYMRGRVAYVEHNPFQSSAGDTTTEIFNSEEDVEKSSDVGLDLGITYDARDALGLKVALVGKYLNSPSFAYPDNEDATDTPAKPPSNLTIDPQFRIGVSGYPLDFMPVDIGSDWWQMSLDYDLTENETIMGDYKKQYLAVGNEFNVLNSFWANIALRAGVRKNLAEEAEGTLGTAGISGRLLGINFGVSAVTSDKTTKTEDGDKRPTYLGVNLNISGRF